MVPDLDRWRASSSTVANYVWAILKVQALCGELGHALLEVQRSTDALNSRREADRLLAEAQALLTELEPEAHGHDKSAAILTTSRPATARAGDSWRTSER